jgi:predicted permease
MRADRWLYTIPLRLRSVFRRRQVERDLEDEIRFHLERQAKEHMAGGMDPREARRRAQLAFLGVERAKEECRDMRKLNLLRDLLKDLAYAARTMRRSPVFAATAVVTIALGIGASTAIFSVANAVLLRPLPYREPERLVLAFRADRRNNSKDFLYSNADFLDLQAGTRSLFEDMAGVCTFRAFVPREDGGTEQLSRGLVTANFFRLMGARIVEGRDFTAGDVTPQPLAPGVLIPPGSTAILSYEYWQRRYGGSTAAIGQEMRGFGQRGPRIVGVVEPGFRLYFPPAARTDAAPDYWVANNVAYAASPRNLLMAGAVGRLKPGITLLEAQQRMDALSAALLARSVDPHQKILLQPMRDYLVAEVRPALVALFGAVIFLLLIACANVANLLLVRASLRQRELAVRTALGAPRRRLVRQILAEALLLAGLGTALGVGLAWAAIRGLLAIAPANVPRLETTAIDWRVMLFATAAGLASMALFGLIPALRAARGDVMQVLRGGARSGAGGPGAGRLRSGVVAAEVALSFVLLTGSGLMFRSFLELRRIDPGYNPHGLLTFYLTRDWPLARQQGRVELLHEIQSRLRNLPGVENVSASVGFPLGDGGHLTNLPPPPANVPPASAVGADFQDVLPGYFETLGTQVIAGRTFVDADNGPSRRVAVIDQLLAARAFPNESAVGRRIAIPWPDIPWAEVIGVVSNQRTATLANPGRETIYFTEALWGVGVSRHWALRTAGNPANLAGAVRAEIRRIDPQLVLSKMQTMDALVERDQAGTRFSLFLIGAFAAIAILLAGVGLYGVVSTLVERRTAEIGVRMALGAAPAGIFQLVVGRGLRLGLVGIALGLAAALAVTRVMVSMLVNVHPTDPYIFTATAVLFLWIVAAACWVPARRAARLDPAAALRQE